MCSGTRTQVSATYYDDAFAPGGAGISQINLRKRVASITYEESDDGNDATYDNATHYSYDIHGNVNVMVQEVPALNSYSNAYKKVRYEYDLVSGKVNSVHYNEGQADQYHHRYLYDADNRIRHVQTSRDKIHWDNDASYYYYPHGPLMRAEIGDNKVQGLDFAYTLHGWIKGVNSGILDPNRDMGKDAKVVGGNSNQFVGRDAFGYILGYYNASASNGDDYTAINSSGSNHFEPASSGSDLMNFRKNLYNGNITTMQTALPNCSTYNASRSISSETFGNAYNYDQLNRIKSSRTFTNLNTGTNLWASSGTVSQNYSTDYTYDANGNITGLTRWGNSSAMDEFSYNYDVQGGRLISNKLYHVNDNTALSGNYSDDIDDQGSFTSTPGTINSANNYGYDELGNLERDNAEEIASIEWNVQGKIKKINRTGGSTKPVLEFSYDAQGHRSTKKITESGGNIKKYYYIRDAQGNEMCRYIEYINGSDTFLVSEEHSIYGSSRLGVDMRKDTLYKNTVQTVAYDYVCRNLGLKQYELSNHLGNVLATVTDQRKPNSAGGLNVDNYDPVIVSISDYYPFGSVMQGRNWTDVNRNYRYGFSGQEKDFETASDNYDFGARIYDGRLGRWLSLDPLSKKFPEESNYVYVSNCSIFFIDIEGEEKYYSTDGTYLGQIGTNSNIRVVDKNHVKHYTIAQWRAIIKAANDYTGAPGENWSSDLIFYGSTSYEDYFANATDVTNGAPVVYYDNNCFTAAVQQLNNAGYDQCGPGSNAMQTKVDANRQEGANNPVYKTDPIGASIYIMTQLKLGIPVIVGVQEPYNGNTTSVGNKNDLTGHFVVINSCTVDANGDVSFGFIDNASTGNGDKIDNQLKLDKATGTMVDEARLSTGADSYTVTEVRKNKKLP